MRLPVKPPRSPKHTEERLKLLASGLQALALAMFAAVVIAPQFNDQFTAPTSLRISFALIASFAEGVAFVVLRYIPTTTVT